MPHLKYFYIAIFCQWEKDVRSKKIMPLSAWKESNIQLWSGFFKINIIEWDFHNEENINHTLGFCLEPEEEALKQKVSLSVCVCVCSLLCIHALCMSMCYHGLASTGCHGYLAILWLLWSPWIQGWYWYSSIFPARFFLKGVFSTPKKTSSYIFSFSSTITPFSSNSTCIRLLTFTIHSLFILLSFAFLTIPPLSLLVSYFFSLSSHLSLLCLPLLLSASLDFSFFYL